MPLLVDDESLVLAASADRLLGLLDVLSVEGGEIVVLAPAISEVDVVVLGEAAVEDEGDGLDA